MLKEAEMMRFNDDSNMAVGWNMNVTREEKKK